MSQRQQIQRALNGLSAHKRIAFNARLKWLERARPKQIPPSDRDWFAFLALAGRGFGKTKLAAEDSWWYCAWNDRVRLAVVAPTNADLRRTVFEGDSGLLSCCPEELMLGGKVDSAYNKSTYELKFWNGSMIQGFSSESYQRLRGPQFHRGWAEELAAWPYLQETFDMLNMTLRLVPPSGRPQLVISTTPKPFKLIKELATRADVYRVSGGTYENKANLADAFLSVIERQYSGTRIGKQELDGVILEDIEGALWNWTLIERARYLGICPEFSYITVNLDPSVGDGNPDNDECGITATGLGRDGFGYLLGDKSLRGSPNEWVSAAAKLYHELGAHWIVAEQNNGGKLIEDAIRAHDSTIPVRLVHASKGKRTRAEPVAMLYEQGRIRHFGVYGDLETQLCDWSPEISDYSPGRLDSLVWGFTALMVEKPSDFFCFVA